MRTSAPPISEGTASAVRIVRMLGKRPVSITLELTPFDPTRRPVHRVHLPTPGARHGSALATGHR
jgi:hypothetical protein